VKHHSTAIARHKERAPSTPDVVSRITLASAFFLSSILVSLSPDMVILVRPRFSCCRRRTPTNHRRKSSSPAPLPLSLSPLHDLELSPSLCVSIGHYNPKPRSRTSSLLCRCLCPLVGGSDAPVLQESFLAQLIQFLDLGDSVSLLLLFLCSDSLRCAPCACAPHAMSSWRS
jgi:hypothetical protein